MTETLNLTRRIQGLEDDLQDVKKEQAGVEDLFFNMTRSLRKSQQLLTENHSSLSEAFENNVSTLESQSFLQGVLSELQAYETELADDYQVDQNKRLLAIETLSQTKQKAQEKEATNGK